MDIENFDTKMVKDGTINYLYVFLFIELFMRMNLFLFRFFSLKIR